MQQSLLNHVISANYKSDVNEKCSSIILLCVAFCAAVRSPDEPYVEDDIAYDSESERNADPCTSTGCMWPKSSDGNVYVPYTLSSVFCK